MVLSGCMLFAAAAIPLVAAYRVNRSTTLFHAMIWAWLALAGWAVAFATGVNVSRYLALVLTGCAGMTVLGARRPGAAAWNFVVVGLLVVLLLPLGEAAVREVPLQLNSFRALFMVVLLGLTVVNYLPTRLAGGAVLLGIATARELLSFVSDVEWTPMQFGGLPWTAWTIGLAPPAAWIGILIGRRRETGIDQLWQSFRDRFGLVWALRLGEQFNRATANSDLPVELGWTGLRPTTDAASSSSETASAYELLAALMKRFGLP